MNEGFPPQGCEVSQGEHVHIANQWNEVLVVPRTRLIRK